MKLRVASLVVCLLTVVLARAGEAPVGPQEAELNGIAVLGDIQCAVIALPERKLVLSVGESRYGIRVLEMDAASGRVQIDNHGQKQLLRIHAAPDLAATAAAMEAAVRAASAPDSDGRRPEGVDDTLVNTAFIPGNPGWGTLPLNTPVVRPAKPDVASSGSTSILKNPFDTPVSVANGQNADVATGASGSESATPLTKTGQPVPNKSAPDWYKESLAIEKDRALTAPDVIAGNLTPLPRTPLTPSDTPANLVDNVNGVFANHSADFLHQNWSQM